MEDMVTFGDTGYYLRGTGDFATCESAVKPLLKLSAPCAKEPCSMDGMYQPQVRIIKLFRTLLELSRLMPAMGL